MRMANLFDLANNKQRGQLCTLVVMRKKRKKRERRRGDRPPSNV